MYDTLYIVVVWKSLIPRLFRIYFNPEPNNYKICNLFEIFSLKWGLKIPGYLLLDPSIRTSFGRTNKFGNISERAGVFLVGRFPKVQFFFIFGRKLEGLIKKTTNWSYSRNIPIAIGSQWVVVISKLPGRLRKNGTL